MESLNVVFNVVTAGVVGMLGFFMKAKFEELGKVSNLLNQTREEIARDAVPRSEYKSDMKELGEKIDQSFHRLETKIDKIAERGIKQ